MKSLKEIENMTLEQLEAVSMNGDITAPEGFRARLDALLDESGRRKRYLRVAGIAAGIMLLLGAGYGAAEYMDRPKDTFEDPYLAYAEVERAFAMMSEGMKKGLDMAEDSETIISRTTQILK